MKKKVILILNVLVILFGVAALVYVVFISEEQDYSRIVKYSAALVGYILAMTGVKKRKPRGYKVYEEQYKDIVGGAFNEDKRSYKQLLQAAVCYNEDKFKKAHQILDKLQMKCTRSRDYVAVYMFRALCYTDEKLYDKSIEAYQKVLQYDMGNSRAWSNMGLRYMEMGKGEEAREAYSNAILYDSKNPFAFNNLGVYHIRVGEPEAALENALRALQLDARMYQAMGTASIAYKMLGEEANSAKYCKMYGINGGDVKALKARLASI